MNTSAFCDIKLVIFCLFPYCGNEYSKGLISYALFLNSFQLSTAFVSIMEKKNAWQIMRNGSSQKECRLCILPVRIDFYNWHDLLNVKIRTWLKPSVYWIYCVFELRFIYHTYNKQFEFAKDITSLKCKWPIYPE